MQTHIVPIRINNRWIYSSIHFCKGQPSSIPSESSTSDTHHIDHRFSRSQHDTNRSFDCLLWCTLHCHLDNSHTLGTAMVGSLPERTMDLRWCLGKGWHRIVAMFRGFYHIVHCCQRPDNPWDIYNNVPFQRRGRRHILQTHPYRNWNPNRLDWFDSLPANCCRFSAAFDLGKGIVGRILSPRRGVALTATNIISLWLVAWWTLASGIGTVAWPTFCIGWTSCIQLFH